MTTVKDLIEQLEKLPTDEPIIFQYLIAENLGRGRTHFAKVSEYLMNNGQFGDDATELFISWVREAEDILEEVGKEDNA